MTKKLKYRFEALFLIFFYLGFCSKLQAKVSYQLNPFIGFQLFGQTSIYEAKEEYTLKASDITLGLRLGLHLEKFKIGFEYFGGVEKSTRYDLVDQWGKSAFGVFGSFPYEKWALRTTLYLSTSKTLKSDGNAGPGNEGESAQGRGGGLGLDYQWYPHLLLSYDYRHLSYDTIGDKELVPSNYSELENKEYVFGLSYLFNFESNLF